MLIVFAVLDEAFLGLLVKNLGCIKLLLTPRHRDNAEASTGKSFSDVDRLEKRKSFPCDRSTRRKDGRPSFITHLNVNKSAGTVN